ncbi:MAG TPA: HEPN domain-containing protein [Lamprocystis sp. (in: g-proteobacteria)]|nr:HEPN domain-containing protein [Lamprocystis sp. (in: g-proteobacteria)]
MTPFIEEAARLLRLAERDYRSFSILFNHPDADLAAACFHAQQSVEKALKAVLTMLQVGYPRTHDLELLGQLIIDEGIEIPLAPRELRRLNPYAVVFRYDEQSCSLLTGEQADRIATDLLAWANSQTQQVAAQFP